MDPPSHPTIITLILKKKKKFLWLYNILIIYNVSFTCVMGHMKYWGGSRSLELEGDASSSLHLLFSFNTSLSSLFNSSCSSLSLLNTFIDKLYFPWRFLITLLDSAVRVSASDLIFSSSSFVSFSAFSVSFLRFNSMRYTFSDSLAYILWPYIRVREGYNKHVRWT